MKHDLLISRQIRAFAASEDGAVTVDWVVLTAAIVMLGMAAGFTVTANLPQVANAISSTLSNTELGN